ncbi:hypothetical protein [Pseudomonas fluorescens]|uniref:hypothetical protein n=1 Tax=Pseudomonas fluorescens TaxID=294 RepID=UPI0007D07024|nr:hypothetical protein [Pseudomonas fluorescens]
MATDTVAAVDKALGSPVDFESSDEAKKIKRNLLTISVIVIALILGEITASDKISLFGVSLEGVTPQKLMSGLGLFLIYNFLHYIWFCFDLFGEWSIRITGTRSAFITAGMFASKDCDYPSDPKQSSLYNWWRSERHGLIKTERRIEDAEEIAKYLDEVRTPPPNKSFGDLRIDSHLGEQALTKEINSIRSDLQEIKKLLDAPRITVSLRRFDKRFELLLRSQNLKVLLFELLLPNLIAAFAVLLLYGFFTK